MQLIIDLSQKKPRLILENGCRTERSWAGLYRLSETILSELDKLLEGDQVSLKDIDKIRVIPSPESMVSTRIAKAVALGLKEKLHQ